MRKSSTLSAELLRNDEGSSAFEFAVDGQPLIRGNIDSIQASFFRFADGGLPLLHEMSGYFNDGYVESLPMNAYLISCCSCGAPGCGHNWCSIKSLKGNVLLKSRLIVR